MPKANNKTKPIDKSVEEYINSLPQDKQADAKKLDKMLREITGKVPEMWSESIVGYGKYHYVYKSKREDDFLQIGFSMRKSSISIYLMDGNNVHAHQLSKLGKHKIGKSCLYINKLEDIDLEVLKLILDQSYTNMNFHTKTEEIEYWPI